LAAAASTEGMTAVFFYCGMSFSRPRCAVINEVRGINRGIYDVTSKPPGTIEWE
jgi:GMP synthase PP-ATPase subunit